MQRSEENELYDRVIGSALALFQGQQLDREQRHALVLWLLANQQPANGFLFVLPEAAGRPPLPALLTGERPRTRLLARNAFECETLRLLALLGDGEAGLAPAFETADRRLSRMCFASLCTVGECAHASIAYLRYRAARGGAEALTGQALAVLREQRDGHGGWHRFPFWYTLLWLAELPRRQAGEELAYLLPDLPGRRLGAPANPVRRALVLHLTGRG